MMKKNSYLYSINYLGMNTSSISGEKIENFEHKIKVYKSCSKGKLASFCLINIFLFGVLFNKCLKCETIEKIFSYITPFGFLISYLLYIIFVIICLSIHVQYITNFMNEINLDFEREKNDFKWNLISLIFIIPLICLPYFEETKETEKNEKNEENKSKKNRK